MSGTNINMKQKTVIVVGMHRSGTSAISGLLAELGVFMGSSLFAPQKEVNEKGFFENSHLVKMNEKLLDTLFWSWDDPLAATINGDFNSQLNPYVPEALTVLNKDYSNRLCWGMKDPRTTLLLPFWKKVFERMSVSPLYVLMIRPPIEVYGSLKKRDGFSLDKSMMLWINYTLTAYFCCNTESLFILDYHSLLKNPENVAREIDRLMGLNFNFDKTSLNFVDNDLRNQGQIEVEQTELVALATELYAALSNHVVLHSDIVKIADSYNKYLQLLSPVLIEHLQSVKRDEVTFRNDFLNAYESIWWKIAWPLKKIEKAIFGKN